MATRKRCNRCKQSLPATAFGKDNRTKKDGLQGQCRYCQNEVRRIRYAKDPSYNKRMRERQRKYNANANKRQRANIENFSDTYVIAALKRGTTLDTKDIRKYPELIETQRLIMQSRRKCKKSKT